MENGGEGPSGTCVSFLKRIRRCFFVIALSKYKKTASVRTPIKSRVRLQNGRFVEGMWDSNTACTTGKSKYPP